MRTHEAAKPQDSNYTNTQTKEHQWAREAAPQQITVICAPPHIKSKEKTEEKSLCTISK